MNDKQKEVIDEALESIDWYHHNISEIMESMANSPAEIMPTGNVSDDHYESLAGWLDIDLEESEGS